MTSKLIAAASILGILIFGTAAFAQADYPNKPVTIVVPFAAGGPNDIMSRIVAEHMRKTLGQPVIVENSPGAGGTLGSAKVSRAQPDGYTILAGHVGTHAAAPSLYPKLPYDPQKNFVPVGLVAETPMLLAVRKGFPATTVAEFAKVAREKGTGLTSGHAGAGSLGHIACLLLNAQIGAKPTDVPYRGSAPAMVDVMAGRVDYMCGLLVDVLPQVGADTMTFLAVSAPSRLKSLPNVPTNAEAGIPGFKATSWFAYFLPADTPLSVRDKVSAALSLALDDASVGKRFEEVGLILPAADRRGPDQLAKLLDEEIKKWNAIITSAGVKLE
jgi:tripartite-type tricarboxylate transporter receptor subunit TctC